MGRKAALGPAEVETIRNSTKPAHELAREFEVSILTIGKVVRRQGAYKQETINGASSLKQWPVGAAHDVSWEPSSGKIDGIIGPEGCIPFDPPVRHE